ncbi:MAG: HopJ type III effector protein [Methylococcales bacterium]|nr:HopJ type III effector protein [Methylococcales bacterium]
MLLNDFLTKVKAGEPVNFADTIAVITENYIYTPTAFRNGNVENAAGQNEGSCKIFAFAKLNQLNESETLSLFGDYYRIDVLQNPDASDHQNIRQFIQNGWTGVVFESEALKTK